MQPVLDAATDLQEVARTYFGYTFLRAGQEAAIRSVVEGHDTLAVMPTGSGKSAIYQIASLLIPGPTVIVSPLIALQHDQVEAINARRAGTAAVLNSRLGVREREEFFEGLESGDLDFIFLAPEQFANEDVLDHIRAVGPSLFVVDEAHCISEWGHDFRPDYLHLGEVVEVLAHPRVLAMTATAAPPVREEIVERLRMRDARVVVRDFDRPNIWLGVEHFHDEQTKTNALIERVVAAEKPGIVYVATHAHAEAVADELRQAGVRARHYHAGMHGEERTEAYDQFMAREIDVIVATIAFGMGIDKPDVRFVFHYDVSDSVDSYYQEIGRAGRDDKPARAILFYRQEDLNLQRFLGSSGHLDVRQVVRVARAVDAADGPSDRRNLARDTHLSQAMAAAALTWLEHAGVVGVLPTGEAVATRKHADVERAAREAVELQERRRQFEHSRIDMMRAYAEGTNCRREYLLTYFGEEIDDPCGNCDNCDAGRSLPENAQNEPFPINSRVTHEKWGAGMVLRYEGDTVVVLFDAVGYKTLDVALVVQQHLLRLAS